MVHSWIHGGDSVLFLVGVGGKLVYQTTKKRASGPKCPVTGKRIQGVCHPLPPFYFKYFE